MPGLGPVLPAFYITRGGQLLSRYPQGPEVKPKESGSA